MSEQESGKTGTTLTDLLTTPGDPARWRAFVDRYGPMIYAWCRGLKLNQADAEDVTQNVLLKLATVMKSFVYDRSASFRAWLRTVTRHAWVDFLRQRKRPGSVGTGYAGEVDPLADVGVEDSFLDAIDQTFCLELVARAEDLLRIRGKFSDRDWRVYHALVKEGLGAEAVAAREKMTPAAVHMVKYRMVKAVKAQVERLDRGAVLTAEEKT